MSADANRDVQEHAATIQAALDNVAHGPLCGMDASSRNNDKGSKQQ